MAALHISLSAHRLMGTIDGVVVVHYNLNQFVKKIWSNAWHTKKAKYSVENRPPLA